MGLKRLVSPLINLLALPLLPLIEGFLITLVVVRVHMFELIAYENM